MKQLDINNREVWRAWLAANHDKESEVWLIFHKKDTGKPTIDYESAVQEALCFGWIDSIIKKIDEQRYARKFTPRNTSSFWSESNKKRVRKLIERGRMTEHGMRAVNAAQQSGLWDKQEPRPEIPQEMPFELVQAFNQNHKAKAFFEQLTPSQQKQYRMWIATAKRPETREKRVRETIVLLKKGEKLGLK